MRNFLLTLTIMGITIQGASTTVTFSEDVPDSFYKHKEETAQMLLLIEEAKRIVPGSISIKYEISDRDGSYISSGKGDAGGKSYGISQFTSKGDASANSFVEWLFETDVTLGSFFLNADKAGTDSFDKAWKNAFNFSPETFTNYQRQYTMEFYVVPFISECKEELGVNFNKTLALQESAYSLAVQFGKNGALTIARNSGISSASSEEEVIKLLYSEKRNSVGTYKFLYCEKDVQESVYNRFINEEQDILDIYLNNPCNSLINITLDVL